MRRGKQLALVLAALAPATAWASGGEHHGFDWQFGVNFLVLVVAMVLLLRKKFRAALEARATGIRKDMDDAAHELQGAEALAGEKRGHLAGLEADRDAMLARFREDAVRERERVVGEARAKELWAGKGFYAPLFRERQASDLDFALSPDEMLASQFGVHPQPGLGQGTDGILVPGLALGATPSGAQFIGVPGGGRPLARMAEEEWRVFQKGLDALPNRPEWLLIHGDASCSTRSLALMAETRILITQARKAALTDAYGLLKSAEQLHPARSWQVVMMNSADPAAASNAFASLAATARRFLNIELALLGVIPRDARLEQAARQMRPLLDVAPQSAAALAFRGLAETILERIGEKAFQWHDFWQKMWLFSRGNAHLPATQGMLPQWDRPW